MKPSVLEMFCADGYYSFWMRKNLDVGRITAIDLDKRGIELGRAMSKILGDDLNFKCINVFDVPLYGKYDMLLCAGGLSPQRSREIVEDML